VNKEGKSHGFAKKWKEDGSIYEGYYVLGLRVKGKEYFLRHEAKHSVFDIEYDFSGE
jgi:hypothetical protein